MTTLTKDQMLGLDPAARQHYKLWAALPADVFLTSDEAIDVILRELGWWDGDRAFGAAKLADLWGAEVLFRHRRDGDFVWKRADIFRVWPRCLPGDPAYNEALDRQAERERKLLDEQDETSRRLWGESPSNPRNVFGPVVKEAIEEWASEHLEELVERVLEDLLEDEPTVSDALRAWLRRKTTTTTTAAA